MKYLSLLFLSFFFLCCSSIEEDTVEVKAILHNSSDHIAIIESCHWIIEKKLKDQSLVKALLTHVLDGREATNSFTYYGQDVYESRIKALEFVTGAKSPIELTYHEDALIVDFYLDWALKEKLIVSKDELELIHPYVKEIFGSDDFIKTIVNYDKVEWLKKYSWPKPPPYGVFHN